MLVQPNSDIMTLPTISSVKEEVYNMAAVKRLSGAERKKEIMDSATKVIAEKGLGTSLRGQLYQKGEYIITMGT